MRNELKNPVRGLAICFLASLALGVVAFAQQARVKPVQQVTVVDSNGKTVGRTLGGVSINNIEISPGTDLKMRTVVLLQVDQTVVPVMVGRDRFYGGAGLAYESEDCMGMPFFAPGAPRPVTDAPSLLPQVAIAPPGQTIYMAIPGAAPVTITMKSSLEYGLRCENRTVSNVPAIPTQPLLDLLTVFTPPFNLRAAP